MTSIAIAHVTYIYDLALLCRYLAKGCPFTIKVSYNRTLDKLVITESELTHNHRLGEDLYETHPSVRRLDNDMKSEVNTLLEMNADVARVREHLSCKYGKYVTLKDLHNARAVIRKVAGNGETDAQSLLTLLQKIQCEDSDSVVNVQVTQEAEIHSVFIETGAMKFMYEKYPEILFIDTTYCVNQYGMPLFVLLCMDSFGFGRPVGYALIADEVTETFTSVLQFFKEQNKASERLNCVILDKDYAEIDAVKVVFPNSRVSLCLFHVMKAWKKEMSGIEAELRNKLVRFIQQMALASTQDKFEEIKSRFLLNAPERLQAYYIANWDGIRDMWSGYESAALINFGNRTNNRLESYNQKLKFVLKHSDTICNCINGLLLMSRSADTDYNLRAVREEKTVLIHHDVKDDLAVSITNICSDYPSRLILAEYKLMLDGDYKMEETESFYDILSKHRSYQVTLNTLTCNCGFHASYKLPCRHILHVLKLKGLTVNANHICERWMKSHVLDNREELSQDVQQERFQHVNS